MKKGVIISVLLVLGVLLGIAIIDSGAERPIDWRKTYNMRDKVPFGIFVLHEELPGILGRDRQYRDFGASFYEEIGRLDSAGNYDAVLIEISDYVGFGDEEIDKILAYASKGGEVFISAKYFGVSLLDTLGLYVEALDYQRFRPTAERVKFSLVADTTQITIDRQEEFQVFSKLNPSNSTILGYIHSRGRAIPNFVQVRVGDGYVYMHAVPEVFGNYHILQEQTYDYAVQVLNVVRNNEILFSDIYYAYEQPRTPLRVILTQPGFYQAWYLLLVGLVLLLVFKSRREQRAVKVLTPEPNLSKEFAETIGNMYYENGHPANIIHKKIDYFLFAIRASFQLDTMELLDDRFIKQLSLKSGVDVTDTRHLMHILEKYRKTSHHQIDDVQVVNNLIEDYKQKANIT